MPSVSAGTNIGGAIGDSGVVIGQPNQITPEQREGLQESIGTNETVGEIVDVELTGVVPVGGAEVNFSRESDTEASRVLAWEDSTGVWVDVTGSSGDQAILQNSGTVAFVIEG